MIKDFIDEYQRYKATGQKAIDQISDDDLNKIIGPDNNSLAMLVRHISGNLISRFTDFLTSDGEKTWRDRDSEFEDKQYDRQDVRDRWARGFSVVETQLAALQEPDLTKTIYIRGQAMTVHEALCRSLAHTSYHVGQMVLLARILSDGNWKWITIPKGQSHEYNQNPTLEKKPG